jgi:putative addiction module killer protein
MTSWTIEYLSRSSFEKWLDKLSDVQLISIAKEMELLRLCGHELRMPHSKALTKGVFELRERKFGLRIYYTFQFEKIILLVGGSKDSQQRDIAKAYKLNKELKNEKI